MHQHPEIAARVLGIADKMREDKQKPDLLTLFALLRDELPAIDACAPDETRAVIFSVAAALLNHIFDGASDRASAEGGRGISTAKLAAMFGVTEEKLLADAKRMERETGKKLLYTDGQYLN